MSAGVLNAVGNSRRSLVYLMIAAISNIFLDLIMVVGLKLGIVGAALATDISQLISCIFIWGFLIRSEDVYKLKIKAVSYTHLDVYKRQLFKQVKLEMEEKITEANLDFRLDIPEEKVIVALDGQKTYRIFENLIGNAMKYAMPHTRVYVKIAAEEGEAVFRMKNVSATELTFNPKEIPERFVRGDSARNTEGSGLGLAIVKSFVEIQKGKFWIETEADLFKAEIRWKLVDKKDDIA